jgi:hypothetical protein
MDAGNNIVMTAGNNINLMSGTDTTALAGGNLRFNATSGEITALAGSNVNITGQGQMTLKSGGIHNRSAPQILDNTATPADAPTVSPPATTAQSNGETSVNSPVSRMPNHEPWNGHPSSKSATPPSGITSGSFTPNPNVVGAPKPFKQSANTTSSTTTEVAQTGDGNNANYTPVPYSGAAVSVNNVNIRADVLAAIKNAASISGMDFGFLMAMAYIESTFDPTAVPRLKNGTLLSSAKGLYQFLDATWASIVKAHGSSYNITVDMRSDVTAQALMGAFFAADNQASLKKFLTRGITFTDLYLAHFMGCGSSGAPAFLRALANTPTANAKQLFPTQAGSNPQVFTDTRTVADVYAHFQGIIEPRAVAYNSANT